MVNFIDTFEFGRIHGIKIGEVELKVYSTFMVG